MHIDQFWGFSQVRGGYFLFEVRSTSLGNRLYSHLNPRGISPIGKEYEDIRVVISSTINVMKKTSNEFIYFKFYKRKILQVKAL